MDSLMKEMGECGRFQVGHVFLVQLCRSVTAWVSLLMVFGLYNPGYRCITNSNNATSISMLRHGYLSVNPSQTHYTDASIIISSSPQAQLFLRHRNRTSDTHSEESRFNYLNYLNATRTDLNSRNSNILHQYLVQRYNNSSVVNGRSVYSRDFITGETGDDKNTTAPAYDGTCDVITSCDNIEFNKASSTVVSRFGLVCDRVWIGSFIVAVLNLGSITGSIFWGKIGELFGRKICLYGSNITMTLACGLAIFSPLWQVYACFTFLIGLGVAGVTISVSPLCMEYLNSNWRARIASIPWWNASIISLALVIYLLRDWQYIHLTSAIAGAISCLGMFWTPESIRWLILHDKSQKVERIVQKISAINKQPVSKEIFDQFIQTKDNNAESKHYSYLDLFRSPELRSTAIKIGFLGIPVLVSYDILGYGIQSLPGNYYSNIIMASFIELPGTLSVGPMASRIGRRGTGIFLMSVGTVCCATIVIALLVIDDNGVKDILITSLAFINKAACQATAELMLIYVVELVPTAARSLAFSILFVTGRTCGMFAVFLIPRDLPTMVVSFGFLMALQLASAFVFMSLPETKDMPIGSVLVDNLDESSKGYENQLNNDRQHCKSHMENDTTRL